jgi:hypothetical protein
MEDKIDSFDHNSTQSATKLDDDVEKRIIKLESTLAETKKELKKDRKKSGKTPEKNPETEQINQKAIEDTIQTIMVDVVDELTANEARVYESAERRIKDLEVVVDQSQNTKSLSDRKINNELRRLAAIVDSQKFNIPSKEWLQSI